MYPWESSKAADKWEYLQDRGYLAEHTTREGVSFRKRGSEVRGFIDWWGKVVWEDGVDE